jgi:hypothetical protein
MTMKGYWSMDTTNYVNITKEVEVLKLSSTGKFRSIHLPSEGWAD